MSKRAKPKRNSAIQPGDRFGRLVVVAYAGKRYSKSGKSQSSYWHCECDCGGEKTPRARSLRAGTTQSCGCLQKERAGPPVKHGMGGTPEYRAWQHMKNRCLNPRSQEWSNYGGRGIKVHGPWKKSFELFFEHVGEKPEPKEDYSLDRIDNDGHYVPGNVRWATMEEQNRNKRRRKLGRTKPEGKAWYWRGRWRTHKRGGFVEPDPDPRQREMEMEKQRAETRQMLPRCGAPTGTGGCFRIVSASGEKCYLHREDDDE